jgi:hypothetical protein
MELVTKEVRKLGGVFEVREVESLDDVDCNLLVNCSGVEMVNFVAAFSRTLLTIPMRCLAVTVRPGSEALG